MGLVVVPRRHSGVALSALLALAAVAAMVIVQGERLFRGSSSLSSGQQDLEQDVESLNVELLDFYGAEFDLMDRWRKESDDSDSAPHGRHWWGEVAKQASLRLYSYHRAASPELGFTEALASYTAEFFYGDNTDPLDGRRWDLTKWNVGNWDSSTWDVTTWEQEDSIACWMYLLNREFKSKVHRHVEFEVKGWAEYMRTPKYSLDRYLIGLEEKGIKGMWARPFVEKMGMATTDIEMRSLLDLNKAMKSVYTLRENVGRMNAGTETQEVQTALALVAKARHLGQLVQAFRLELDGALVGVVWSRVQKARRAVDELGRDELVRQ